MGGTKGAVFGCPVSFVLGVLVAFELLSNVGDLQRSTASDQVLLVEVALVVGYAFARITQALRTRYARDKLRIGAA